MRDLDQALCGLRRTIEITRVKITEAGRRALFELQYCGPAAGMIDSLDEAKAAFQAAWERHERPRSYGISRSADATLKL